MPHPTPPRPEDPEELAQNDDAVIGRALKRSAVALCALGVLAGGTAWWLRWDRGPGVTRVTQLAAPKAATNAAAASIPKVRFTDVTTNAGVRFRHETGATGEKLLPETMGGGVALHDLDGDGLPELLFVNGSHWPWARPQGAGAPPPGLVLYRNTSTREAVRFEDVTAMSGLGAPFYGMGVAVGDADGDGRPDLLVTGVGGARLFLNRSAGPGSLRFEDSTAAAGVGGAAGDWSSSALWLDMDRDGDLDLFVASYVEWSREVDAKVGYKIDGQTRAYGPPMNFAGALPRLYRNEGGGRFTDVSATSGVQVRNPATQVPAAKTLGLALVDVNRDGWPDVVAANDTVQNFVFVNQRNGTFREAGAESGVAFDSYGNPRGAMGVDAGRFTPDGRLGVFIGNFANEMTAVYVEAPGSTPDAPLFQDEALSWGVGGPSRDPLKFGVLLLDYDLDGRLDLLTVNGHLEEEIAKIQHGQRYRQPAQLFWNAGDAGFQPVGVDAAGPDLFQPIVGRGSATADIDGDGDPDLVFAASGGAPLLLRNDQQTGHHWLHVRLAGKGSNTSGLGATVRVRANGKDQWRCITTTRSYLSASPGEACFGLGTATIAEVVEVEWPDGHKSEARNLPADRVHVLSRE